VTNVVCRQRCLSPTLFVANVVCGQRCLWPTLFVTNVVWHICWRYTDGMAEQM
jgi:hypothetical protein